MRYNPGARMSSLIEVWVSQASAQQRAGKPSHTLSYSMLLHCRLRCFAESPFAGTTPVSMQVELVE